MKTLFFLFLSIALHGQVPPPVAKLLKAYPEKLSGYRNNVIVFRDGSTLVYDDGAGREGNALLDRADIQDQFRYVYTKGKADPSKRTDAGRIRNEAFFKKLYGSSRQEVAASLKTIVWCPSFSGQKIQVNKANGVADVVQKLSDELDRHPEYKKYLVNIGGTFNWRYIAGSKRLSMHSFGMTIDLNTKYANYWQWDCKCQDEGAKLVYHNSIPDGLVEIFEKHGFIWGGKWVHYDTMHFEYRPEMVE